MSHFTDLSYFCILKAQTKTFSSQHTALLLIQICQGETISSAPWLFSTSAFNFATKTMPESEQFADEKPETETDDVSKFGKSLLELKDLCSQLHHAANYCEATFLNATEKSTVIENTKEYICRAVVTAVDHLGSVSANLECRLAKINSVSETEYRIDRLKQSLATCQQYSHKLSLRGHYWNADFPRYHSRYISLPIKDRESTNKISREPGGPTAATAKTIQFEADEGVPLFLYTYNCKPSLVKNSELDNSSEKRSGSRSPVLPVPGGLSIIPKPQHPYFQLQDSPKLKHSMLNRKFKVQNKDLMSLVRRGKRALT